MATKEIFDRVYGKSVQAIVGGDGKQLIPDGEHDLAMIARKVAFAFRIMAQSNEPKQIESGRIDDTTESPSDIDKAKTARDRPQNFGSKPRSIVVD